VVRCLDDSRKVKNAGGRNGSNTQTSPTRTVGWDPANRSNSPVPGAVDYLEVFSNKAGEGAGWGWIWRWRLLIIDVIMFGLEGGKGKKKTERARRKEAGEQSG
jgi:hypothetical protein